MPRIESILITCVSLSKPWIVFPLFSFYFRCFIPDGIAAIDIHSCLIQGSFVRRLLHVWVLGNFLLLNFPSPSLCPLQERFLYRNDDFHGTKDSRGRTRRAKRSPGRETETGVRRFFFLNSSTPLQRSCNRMLCFPPCHFPPLDSLLEVHQLGFSLVDNNFQFILRSDLPNIFIALILHIGGMFTVNFHGKVIHEHLEIISNCNFVGIKWKFWPILCNVILPLLLANININV